MTDPLDLAAVKARSAACKVSHECAHQGYGCERCEAEAVTSAADVPALVAEVERLAAENARLRAEKPEWIVNDNAELGVMVNGRAFFLYKGRSLEYEDAKHDDGSRMMYRPVGKREFGECCHPLDMKSMPDRYAVPLKAWKLDDGRPRVVELPNGGWMPLPVNDAALRAAGGG